MPMKNPPHPGHSIKDAWLERHRSRPGARHCTAHPFPHAERAGCPLKWRSGSKRPDGQTPITGSVGKPPTIWHRHSSTRTRSRCGATSRGQPPSVRRVASFGIDIPQHRPPPAQWITSCPGDGPSTRAHLLPIGCRLVARGAFHRRASRKFLHTAVARRCRAPRP